MIELIGIIAVIVLVLLGGLAIAFEKGWIGLSASRLAKMRARVDELQDKFDEAAKKKADAMKMPDPPWSRPQTKNERIASNAALLAAGTITQADFDAAKAKILAE